jgi:Domain of unknown function (DUF4281)
MESIFQLTTLAVAPFWLAMMLAPRARLTSRLLGGFWGIVVPIAVYAALAGPHLAEVLPVVLRPDLPRVAALLATPAGATLAWAHFLAFDLFVGRWIWLDARERNVHPLVLAPILFLTLMLGPLGLALYLGARSLASRTVPAVARVQP